MRRPRFSTLPEVITGHGSAYTLAMPAGRIRTAERAMQPPLSMLDA